MGPHLTKCVAIGVPELLGAAAFYREAFGFTIQQEGPDWIELSCGDLRLFLCPDDGTPPTFEIVVENVRESVLRLEELGFFRIRELEGETIVRDPFGHCFCVTQR